MRLRLITIFALLMVCGSFISIKNELFISHLKNQLQKFRKELPQEKIYVHTDKTIYKPGENIWFNTILLNANNNKPLTPSSVVYVELINPKGNVIERRILNVIEGSINGDFHIPDELEGGIFKIKSYTQWMKNFPDQKAFEKEIIIQKVITPRLLLTMDFNKESYGPEDTVSIELEVKSLLDRPSVDANSDTKVSLNGTRYNTYLHATDQEGKATIQFVLPKKLESEDGIVNIIVNDSGIEESISRSIPIVLFDLNVQLFPEGGYLVRNVESKIAFKSTDQKGNPADFSGHLLNSQNEIIKKLESFHMGMGSFEHQLNDNEPLDGYKLQITSPVIKTIPLKFPEPLDSGYALNLKEQSTNELIFKVYSPCTSIGYLVGRTGDEIQFSKELKLETGIQEVNVNTKDFPMGISAFTLFDESKLERCERLVFIDNGNELDIDITFDKNEYGFREEVKGRVKTTNQNDKPIRAKLSVVAVDDQLISFADDKQPHLLPWMLLSSELYGEIKEPNFYFDPEEEKSVQARDLLLMTHGWRRFKWEEIAKNEMTLPHEPENIYAVSGEVVFSKQNRKPIDVYLIELGSDRRIGHVLTDSTGKFSFLNINPTTLSYIVTKKPYSIKLNSKFNIADSLAINRAEKKTKNLRREYVNSEQDEINYNQVAVDQSLDITISEDVETLSEVIVTAQGYALRSGLAGSIVRMEQQDINLNNSLTNILAGKVTGVQITGSSNSSFYGNSAISIRGYSSINGNQPLVVIDGAIIQGSNQFDIINDLVGQNSIDNIRIIKGVEASAYFGTNGQNGVILITSKNGDRYRHYFRRKPAKYNTHRIPIPMFSATREFYAPDYKNIKPTERTDFRTTLYWNPNLTTDEKGEATFKFYTNDKVSSYRTIVEGFTADGNLGREEETFQVTTPVAIDVKSLKSIGLNDTLKLPVRITNNLKEETSGKLEVSLPKGFQLIGDQTIDLTIPSEFTKQILIPILPGRELGTFNYSLSFESNDHKDTFRDQIEVMPVGFPVEQSFSGNSIQKSFQFEMDNDIEKNSVRANFKAYPTIVSDLFAGAESIFRQPHGCFEQVSSSTFPNILALQFLQKANQSDKKIEKKALNYISDGYSRLKAYEIKGGGFEWFGRSPAHEGLTAYGLLEFYEMKKVYSVVSSELIRRTQDYLLGRKDGKGGFRQYKGKYGFSAASKEVNNAYILFALTETGVKDEIDLEYQTTYQEAIKSEDMYRMALVALSAYNLGLFEDYGRLIDLFETKSQTVDLTKLKKDHSIVRSYGHSLDVETVAIWALALLKQEDPRHFDLVSDCIEFIQNKRSYGGFGSTQATAMGLMAITKFASLLNAKKSPGEIVIYANGTIVASQLYSREEELIEISGFHNHLTQGKNRIEVRYLNTENPIPYSVDISWRKKTPESNPNCKVIIENSLDKQELKVNELVRMKTKLINTSNQGVPMSIAYLGIPAGLSLQTWQLKELQDDEVFDFFEIIEDRLAIYYTEMGPNEEKIINLDLKAEIPGTFTGSASSSYLYYEDENKYWVPGNRINIE